MLQGSSFNRGIGMLLVAALSCGLSGARPAARSPRPIAVAAPIRATAVEASELRLRLVRQEAERAGVPAALAVAVSLVENRPGDPEAVSAAGAVGIMQVMPRYWAKAFPDECGAAPLTDPRRNACVGVRVLRHYYERHRTWELALRAYNGSLGDDRAGTAYVTKVMTQLAAWVG